MGLFNFKKKPKITIEGIKIMSREILAKPKVDMPYSEEQMYKASKIQNKAYHYNFDEGYQGIYELLEDEFCDKSTAILFYWLNQPHYYLNNPNSTNSIHDDGRKLKKYLEERVTKGEFNEILQFVPINFIEGPMSMLDELTNKESYLDKIPEEFFFPIGMNFNTTATCNEVNRHLDLSNVRNLYFFDPVDCSDVKKIQADEALKHLNVCFNNYIRTKPKKGKISDLLHLSNLKKLRLEYYVRFTDLDKLTELKHLEHLEINVEKEDYSIFSELCNIKSLVFTSSTATDLVNIQKMTQLEELVITGCPNLTDVSGLDKLTNLRTLKIDLCKKLKKIDGVFETNISTLLFREVLISSGAFKDLKKLNLNVLQLDCKSLKNIDFLLTNNSIKEINFYRLESNNEILEKVKQTDFGNCKIIERDWNNAL